MIKVAVFPIKICARKESNPEEFDPILSIAFEPEEETFNKPDTIPVVDVNLLIETNEDKYVDYICGLNWFSSFYTHTNIYQLFRKVNFACNIKIVDSVEFTDEVKEKLNAFFNVFVSKLKSIVEDLSTYVTLFQESPAFTITMGSEEEAAEHTHEHEHLIEEIPSEEVTTDAEPKSE